MAEDARRCTKCEYKWFAKRVSKPAKTYGAGAGWAALGSTGMAAGAGAKAGAHYATKLERHERWRNCPRCGSRKVGTDRKRGFVPTAAEEAAGRRPPPKPLSTTQQQTGIAPPRQFPRVPTAAPTTPASEGPADTATFSDDDVSSRRRLAKRSGLVLLCIMLGPISLVYGCEAVRRAGRGTGGLVRRSDGRRPLLVAIGGALGTTALSGELVQEMSVTVGAAQPADGEIGIYNVFGLLLGLLISAALVVVTRRGWFSRLRLPDALHGSIT